MVSIDQPLCLMEAMKIFSSITLASFNKKDMEIYSSKNKYKIERINNVSGTQITAGDLLFVVSPVEPK